MRYTVFGGFGTFLDAASDDFHAMIYAMNTDLDAVFDTVLYFVDCRWRRGGAGRSVAICKSCRSMARQDKEEDQAAWWTCHHSVKE